MGRVFIIDLGNSGHSCHILVKLRLGLLEVKVLLSLGFGWKTFALLVLSMDEVSMAFFVLDLGAAHLGCLV